MMKSKNQKKDKHYNIRFRDYELNQAVDDLYSKVCNDYNCKSSFIVECVRRGIEDYKNELAGVDVKQGIDKVVSNMKENTAKINELGKYIFEDLKKIDKLLCGILSISASNEEMLIGLSEDCPRLKQMVNDGDYDKLPKRFESFIGQIVDEIYDVLK